MGKIHIPTEGVNTVSVLAYSSDQPDPTQDIVPDRKVRTCPTKIPEVHELGEFPMSCYRCHMEADS